MENFVLIFISFVVIHRSVGIATHKIGVLYDSKIAWTDLNNTETEKGIVYIPYGMGENEPFALIEKIKNLTEECLCVIVVINSGETAWVLQRQDVSSQPLILLANQRDIFFSSSSLPFDCWLRNQGFVSIVTRENWSHINLFYDDYYDSNCIQDLVHRLSAMGVATSSILMTTEGNTIKGTLSMIRREDHYENVYLALEPHLTLNTIKDAISLDLFERKLHWVMNIDPKYLQNADHYGSLHRSFVLTLSTGLRGNYSDIIKTILHQRASGIENTTENCLTNWTSVQQHYPLRIHSSCKETSDFEEVALFTNQEGLNSHEELFKNKFRDFGNRVLKVASVPNAPYVMKGTKENGETYYYGFCYDILEDYAKAFNFRYESVDGDGGLFGNPTEDGLNASGMVGMVMRGEVDIGVAPFAVTATREQVIDYVLPYQEDGVGILMKRVENKVQKFFRIFLPLHYTTWWAVVVATVVAAYVLYVAAKLSPESKERELQLGHNIWLIVGTVYGQDDGQRPSFGAGRIILGFWWVFTILITASYTANLAAFLTISLAKPPVKNLEELASQTIYKPLIVQETNHHAMFKGATTGLYKRIWDLMSDIPKIKTVEEGYQLVETGQFALLWDYSQFEYLINNDCGSLEIAQESFHKISLSFIIPEKAPFKRAFDNHMLKMIEAGIIAKFKAKWWRKSKCVSSPKTATALETESLSGIFALYGGILAIVLVTFILEVIIVYRKWRRVSKIRQETELDNRTKFMENVPSSFKYSPNT
ncbi:glutamate receptor ionotropic, kainate 2 [Magallana gigas]